MMTIEVKTTFPCKGSKRKHVGRSKMYHRQGDGLTQGELVDLVLRSGEYSCKACAKAISARKK